MTKAVSDNLFERVRDHAAAVDKRMLQQLRGKTELKPATVHALRVAGKQLRAQWKLLREFIPREDRLAAEGSLRDAARKLSMARDLHVMDATLKDLRDKTSHEYEQQALKTVHRQLFNHLGKAAPPRNTKALQAVFSQDLQRWEKLALAIDNRAFVDKGLGNSYRKTRKRAFNALAQDEVTPWHELRKQAKYLLFQLKPLDHPDLPLAVSDLENLGKQLGRLHDKDVLLNYLREQEQHLDDAEAVAITIQVIHRREALLLEKCARSAPGLFKPKPREFRERLNVLWPTPG